MAWVSGKEVRCVSACFRRSDLSLVKHSLGDGRKQWVPAAELLSTVIQIAYLLRSSSTVVRRQCTVSVYSSEVDCLRKGDNLTGGAGADGLAADSAVSARESTDDEFSAARVHRGSSRMDNGRVLRKALCCTRLPAAAVDTASKTEEQRADLQASSLLTGRLTIAQRHRGLFAGM